MQVYIDFFHKSAISEELISACGDRAIIRVDARKKSWRWHAIAQEEGRKRGYPAYQIIMGDSLLQAKSISGDLYKVKMD